MSSAHIDHTAGSRSETAAHPVRDTGAGRAASRVLLTTSLVSSLNMLDSTIAAVAFAGNLLVSAVAHADLPFQSSWPPCSSPARAPAR